MNANRIIKITVTTEDGELLDSATLEVEDNIVGITYRPSTTFIPQSGYDEILLLGVKLP